LISDRQSIRYDGTKEQWDKIYKLHESALVGFSGSSEAGLNLAQSLANLNLPFPSGYVVAYRMLLNLPLINTGEREIEALCITRQNNIIQSYKCTRAMCNQLFSHNPIGIGSGEHIVRPQLDRPTNHLSLQAATDFGKALIQYASIVDTEVGSPGQYGFCAGHVPLQGKISQRNLPPEMVPIDKMLYPL
jgi:hypothetical protein